jgi:phenylpropionate dioxygenase-like ring-hydroxylating dioxygenase large terminal subunit
MDKNYLMQVQILLDVLPELTAEQCFAVDGDTAINFFVRDMPRLSVDIDLTYLPIEKRDKSNAKIAAALSRLQKRIQSRLESIQVSHDVAHSKLVCTRQESQIKIEVNTTVRGSLSPPKNMGLASAAQKAFGRFAEAQIMPIGQLYGGAICAALGRQNPRDLFDIKHMFKAHDITPEIRRGFLFCHLSGGAPLDQPFHPPLRDEHQTLTNQFEGMTDEKFTYKDFEETRDKLIREINQGLTANERQFLISFLEGVPIWNSVEFADFEKFPAIQWRLHNILKLKQRDPEKHRQQLHTLTRILHAGQH